MADDQGLSLETAKANDWSWATVLVVEDNDINRMMMTGLVRGFGVGCVIEAVDGVECLEKMAETIPDLIITDIVMPRMDGVEVCRSIRGDSAFAEIPILVQTAMSEQRDHLLCFAAGASDVLTKPVRPAELRARMRVHLENRRLVHNLRKATQRITREIEGARRMQGALMPKPKKLEAIHSAHGLRLEGMVDPSFSIGGDLWGVIDIDDQAFGVYAADFSGHGVMAALNTFRLHTLIKDTAANHDDPAALLATLNESLVELLVRGQYATFFYAICDTVRHQITWAGAGAPMPILVSDDSWCFLDTVGTPMGFDRHAVYQNAVLPFPPGSGLLIYSDAMSEAQGHDGAPLGEQSILDILMVGRANPLTVDLDGILARFRAKAVLPLADDLTTIWLRHEGRGQTRCHADAVKVIDIIDADSIEQALRVAMAVVEGGDEAIPIDESTRRALDDGALLLSMTTISVYRSSPCAAFCTALLERGWVSRPQFDNLRQALQEATANAVIHGNLGLASPRGSGEEIRRYWRTLRERLDDPVFGMRRVTFLARKVDNDLVVSIADEGDGFVPSPRLSPDHSGRGSILMQTLASAVRWEDGGRRVIMWFRAP